MNKSSSDHISTITQEKNEMSIYKDEESANSNSDLKPITKTIQKGIHFKRNYVNTTNEQRLELIEAVYNHGERVKSAAHRLRINYSAAKAICQIYKSEGRSTKKLPRRRPPIACKIKDDLLFIRSDNTDPLKMLPILMKKENVEEKEATMPFIAEKALQLVKNPLLQCFPEVQKPVNRFDNSPISTSLLTPQQIKQSQNLMQNFLIPNGLPSTAQQNLSRLSIMGLPVISSQTCTSNIFVMFPAQNHYMPSQPIVSVNRIPVLTHPLYNTSQFNNNFQLPFFSPSIPSYRFLF